jgi:hypothetical protein
VDFAKGWVNSLEKGLEISAKGEVRKGVWIRGKDSAKGWVRSLEKALELSAKGEVRRGIWIRG